MNYYMFSNKDAVQNYGIIIPKEEPNPFELPKALPDDVFYESLEPKQECKGSFKDCFKPLDECVCDNMKNKETLEEAAERYARKQCDDMYDDEGLTGANLNWKIALDFKEGAKWQQEQIGKSEFLQRLRGTLSDADKFAIGFAEWIANSYYSYNFGIKMFQHRNKEIYKTTKELLEIYKKEKGL